MIDTEFNLMFEQLKYRIEREVKLHAEKASKVATDDLGAVLEYNRATISIANHHLNLLCQLGEKCVNTKQMVRIVNIQKQLVDKLQEMEQLLKEQIRNLAIAQAMAQKDNFLNFIDSNKQKVN